jgi:hypothetical protein
VPLLSLARRLSPALLLSLEQRLSRASRPLARSPRDALTFCARRCSARTRASPI